jgi:hypothetical protein
VVDQEDKPRVQEGEPSEQAEDRAVLTSEEATLDARANAVGVEPDEPPNTVILALLAGLTGAVLVAAIGLWQLFGLTTSAEIDAKDLRVDSKELLELKARDWGRLTQYESLDGGGYQIPIESAMKKLVEHPSLIAPLSQAAAADAGGTLDATLDALPAAASLDGGAETGRDVPASKSSGVVPSPAPAGGAGPSTSAASPSPVTSAESP